MSPPLLEIDGLDVRLGPVHAVRGVSYRLEAGRTLALVGESGCGKSVSALSLLGLIRSANMSGSVRLDGRELVGLPERELRRVRGREVGIVFQDPLSALHPSMTIGAQLAEAIRAHQPADRAAARTRAVALLERMRLPAARRRLASYPWELSGGQRQRVMIAIALAGRPQLLIADEPTTALDVGVQADIIALLRELQADDGMSLLLISHDLGVVDGLADTVAVMYAGRIVESGVAAEMRSRPQHPYTHALWRARPRLSGAVLPRGLAGKPPALTDEIAGCAFAPRCALARPDHVERRPELTPTHPGGTHLVACLLDPADRLAAMAEPDVPTRRRPTTSGSDAVVLTASSLTKRYAVRRTMTSPRTAASFDAVVGIDVELRAGETLALVGASGCGKSTLAGLLLGLMAPSAGTVRCSDRPITALSRTERAGLIQLVFQDPYASLNPRRTIGESIADPLRHLGRPERARRVSALLDQVGLDPAIASRLPAALSGGERQRVALARALAPEPAVLVADEPVTSLDVSVQAQVLRLLVEIQRDHRLAILLIAHDLAVVAALADRIAVMDAGRIVEIGAAHSVLTAPQHTVTRALLQSALN